MKKIAIVNPSICPIHEDMLNSGCGGSETWAIQIANEFAKTYEVFLFGDCKKHNSALGVHYYGFDEINNVFSTNNFEHIIISRGFKGVVNLVEKTKCCDNIVIQAHDVFLVKGDFLNKKDKTLQEPCSYSDEPELQNYLVKKIITLSDFHKSELNRRCQIPLNIMETIPNGIDLDLFNLVENPNPDHRILLSSADRGNNIVINKILPPLKKLIPDFGVDICLPSYWDDKKYKGINNNSIKYLGHLGKRELYNEMRKHAVWFYPSVFPETFCISSIEAVACGNDIVLPLIFGPATTFKNFPEISLRTTFYTNQDNTINEAVHRIYDSVINYNKSANVERRKRLKEYVINNYTWTNIVKKYENLWKTI